MTQTYRFEEVAKLPLPGDNVAIATRELAAGTVIHYEGQALSLDYTVMEGHRFAVKDIAPGESLLSWELPFGKALQQIQAGHYVINQGVLDALSIRTLKFKLPEAPNFVDQVPPYALDVANFEPAKALPAYPDTRTFLGYRRNGARGVGTRNTIVLLGTTSRTGSYVKLLAARLQGELKNYPMVDGIVPVAHTEGDVDQPNNLDLLLRTLAGFMVHPNVGAVLVVDYGTEPVTNRMLEAYVREHNYPIQDVMHQFLSLKGGFQHNLTIGESIVREWLPTVNAIRRTPESIRHLKIALQCGGSDAFSGISANPLLGFISNELVRYGGSANLAETDELIGAESYVLQKVRNLETARKFLTLSQEFKERASWHGANAEGNPSGGNKYRGLYNIYLKSIGAARKKHPDTRLDYAIHYAEPMRESGFYFMDSPGNDLEGIAGQVASGCNMILFTTGNGSVTNFPFAPTLKVVTTTRRFQYLANDMDINAGQYLDGKPMDELGKEAFELMIQVASGRQSVGEKAGHAQVQIWRDWQQTDGSQLDTLLGAPLPTGEPIPIRTDGTSHVKPIDVDLTAIQDRGRSDGVGLILPTSLCSGQVANQIAQRLNQRGLGGPNHPLHIVALPHTEGCGNSSGQSEEIYARTMMGYITHPLVKHCLLLEHGCEKTHNDFMRYRLEEMGIDYSQLGFASIQGDGGIDKVTQKVEAWFVDQLSQAQPATQATVGSEGLRIGILSDGPVSATSGEELATLAKIIVGAGGTVVVPENSGLLRTPSFRQGLFTTADVLPSLAYGQRIRQTGFHIMETPTSHWIETVTGLAASGVELMVALVNRQPMQTHPFVPMLQVTSEPKVKQTYAEDLDLYLDDDLPDFIHPILQYCKKVMEHSYTPRLYQLGNVDFQLTRGFLGVSL